MVISTSLYLFFIGGGPAGYEVYHRADIAGADTLVGSVSSSQLSHTLTGLAPDSIGYCWVLPRSRCGVGNDQGVSRRLRRVAMDGAADLIPPAPNTPYGLALQLGAGGQVTATWRYRGDGAEAPAAKFQVYVALDVAPFDFNTPAHTVATVSAGSRQDLGSFPDGTTVRCVVRAATAGDILETNTMEASAVAAANPPIAPVTIVAEVDGV